jgi:hypothetical protein
MYISNSDYHNLFLSFCLVFELLRPDDIRLGRDAEISNVTLSLT